MKYDFDKVVDRKGFHSVKHDEKLKKFGAEDVIPLWIADMDFRTSEAIIDALKARAEHGLFGYVSKPDSYKQSAIGFQKRRHNWDIKPEELSFTVGIVPALVVLIRQFSNPGDKILIQTPVYPMFISSIEQGSEPRNVLQNKLIENNGEYSIDFDDFETKLKEGPKLFILCNPHNPIGKIWSKDDLIKMGELCLKYNVPVVSDEIHGDLELFGNKYTPFGTLNKEIVNNSIICFAATKTFNLAGLQAAYLVFKNKNWQNRFDTFWNELDIHRNSSFSLVAMEAAWNDSDDWLDEVLVYIGDNFKFVEKYLKDNIPSIKMHIPEATYLAWLDFRELGLDPKELNKFLVEKAHLGLNNGVDFCPGLNGYMRMNLAHPRATLEKAMNSLEKAVNEII